MWPEGSSPCSQNLPLSPILSLLNLDFTFTPYFFSIYFNIILLYTHRSPKKSLPYMFFRQKFLHNSRFSHACYMSHPIHPSWFNRTNCFRWRIQIMKLLIMYFFPCVFLKLFLSRTFCNVNSLCRLLKNKSVKTETKCCEVMIESRCLFMCTTFSEVLF
jgi:hypothetical protein